LAAQTGETVNLTARFENSVIQLDHVDAVHMLRVSYPAGERFPLHASASGKVFLAAMSATEFERFVDEAPAAFTPATVVRREQLALEVELTRTRGYAVDDAERELGVRCVAAPISDGRGDVDAAISISAPTVRVSRQRLHQLAVELATIAAEISQGRTEPASALAAVADNP
jgi:IclR family acetate operon transcriptional repressor